MNNREMWMELCEQAAGEQSPEKLMELAAEIIRLDEENKRLHTPATSSAGKIQIASPNGHPQERRCRNPTL